MLRCLEISDDMPIDPDHLIFIPARNEDNDPACIDQLTFDAVTLLFFSADGSLLTFSVCPCPNSLFL